MSRAAIIALAACVISAVLEGILAGRGVKEYMRSLRMPRFAPPMPVWIAIGGLYYVVCFVLIYRLVAVIPSSPRRTTAIVLLGAVMLLNAAWNFVFFRARSLSLTVWTTILYTAIALGLFMFLVRMDGTAALVFAPYALYLIFANYWTYGVWRLNW